MKRIALPILGLLALGLAATAGATTVADVTLARAIELSTTVVLGEVTERAVRQQGGGSISTDYVVRVDSTLAGDLPAGEHLTVRHLGGMIGATGLIVPGMPTFVPGERVVLFLIPGGDDHTYRTLGLFLGAYTVTETDSGPVATRKPADGAHIVGRKPAGRMPDHAPLEELVTAIRQHEATR